MKLIKTPPDANTANRPYRDMILDAFDRLGAVEDDEERRDRKDRKDAVEHAAKKRL